MIVDMYLKYKRKYPQVLLELNDTELESVMRISNPMHRKKLRLAIEEQRNPTLIRYPCIAQLGHTWVCNEWLPDIGLNQVRILLRFMKSPTDTQSHIAVL